MKFQSLRKNWPVSLQAGLALAAIFLLALMPPAQGNILIVSLAGQGRGAIAHWAIDHDARLVGAGPLPNSLVVAGTRGLLVQAAIDHGALLLSGAWTGCAQETAA